MNYEYGPERNVSKCRCVVLCSHYIQTVTSRCGRRGRNGTLNSLVNTYIRLSPVTIVQTKYGVTKPELFVLINTTLKCPTLNLYSLSHVYRFRIIDADA